MTVVEGKGATWQCTVGLLPSSTMDPSSGQINHTRSYTNTIPQEKLNHWHATQSRLQQQRLSTPLPSNSIRTIAGIDISFSPSTTSSEAVGALVVMPYPPNASAAPLYVATCISVMTEPYCAGYLAFREMPIYEALFAKLREERPDLWPPDVTLVDGNGVWHPRRLGSAAHLGTALDIPTIGVAKNFFHVPHAGIDDTVSDKLKKSTEDVTEVSGNDGLVYGAAVRSKGTKRHIYVSEGHRVTLKDAVEIVQGCSTYRIPEPVRRADLEGRKVVRELGL